MCPMCASEMFLCPIKIGSLMCLSSVCLVFSVCLCLVCVQVVQIYLCPFVFVYLHPVCSVYLCPVCSVFIIHVHVTPHHIVGNSEGQYHLVSHQISVFLVIFSMSLSAVLNQA